MTFSVCCSQQVARFNDMEPPLVRPHLRATIYYARRFQKHPKNHSLIRPAQRSFVDIGLR